jgi:uncharacterized protein (TIGR03435 family)
MMRALTAVAFAALVLSPVLAQAPATFAIADVHPAPASNMFGTDGGALRGDRYIIRQATMLDLIVAAYGLDRANVQGGPPWLETDKFDIIAKTAPGTPTASIKLMLQSLLAERFALTVHNGTKPMPAYVLTLGKGKPKLKEAAGDHTPGCDDKTPPSTDPGTRPDIALACHNKTMDDLAHDLRDFAGGYIQKPVVNSTGITGAWDYDLIWTAANQFAKSGGISIFDAVDKGLGLKLDLQTAPRPVLIVDSANRKPSPNSPDLARLLPPPPPATFDVAVIKPSKPGSTDMNGRITKDQVNLQNMPLKFLISIAWGFNPQQNDLIIGPKWLDTDHFDILAKIAPDAAFAASSNVSPVDTDELLQMIQNLIAERFQMKSHMEERQISAYVLTAPNSKLKTGDPTARTHCENGPGPDGKDPRIANPVLNRLVYCQNMTMPEMAKKFKEVAGGYISGDVVDETGLTGSYDFVLSFSGAGQFQGGIPASDAPSDPSGAITLFEAVNHQLGLKLEKQKRPVSVLVIDHIDEKPTEN